MVQSGKFPRSNVEVAAAIQANASGSMRCRATGITPYLKNGGTLEKRPAWRTMAAHGRATQLYKRRPDDISLDETERIGV